KRIRSWGMDINRVTLPNITKACMDNENASELELENSINAIKVFGEANIKIVRQRFAGDVFYGRSQPYQAIQRGGAISRGESIGLLKEKIDTPSMEELEKWWGSFQRAYKEMVPIAQDCDVNIAMHPSDTPHPDSPFGGL